MLERKRDPGDKLLQLRFGVGHGFAQHRQTGLVAADVLAQLLQRVVGPR